MFVLFIIAIGLFLFLYIMSKGKYDDLINELDKKDYPIKDFLPMGLWVMDRVNHNYQTRYDSKTSAVLYELFGQGDVKVRLKLHWASRVSFLVIWMLFAAIFMMGADTLQDGLTISTILLGVMIMLPDLDINNKLKAKRLKMQLEFPEFLNKLTLLVNAGMTLSKAWSKIVEENKKVSPLYRELEVVYFEVRAGKSEMTAYEDFAKRCRMPEVTKFVTVVLQNLRKGSGELTNALSQLSEECWKMRTEAAKRIGEEANTKLLLPMMLMLAGIMIIIITPVLIEFQNI